MGVEAVAGGDDAGYVLEAASGAIEGQARGHGFARIDPEIAIHMLAVRPARADRRDDRHPDGRHELRSDEHTPELESLMRTSYAAFCLKKKTTLNTTYKLYYHIPYTTRRKEYA